MPLDIGVGILLSLGVSALFGVHATWLIMLFGIGSTLFPDIDIVTALFGKWRHRTATHYPLTYLPLVVIVWILFDPFYAALFGAGVLAHFIHDTIGTGWGISWFWPFTSRRFLVLPDGPRRKEMGAFATWLPAEHPEWAHRGSHAWVRDIYFSVTTVAIVEYSALVIAAVALWRYLR